MNWNPPPKATVIASLDRDSSVGPDVSLDVGRDEIVRLRERGWRECQCDNRYEGEEQVRCLYDKGAGCKLEAAAGAKRRPSRNFRKLGIRASGFRACAN